MPDGMVCFADAPQYFGKKKLKQTGPDLTLLSKLSRYRHKACSNDRDTICMPCTQCRSGHFHTTGMNHFWESNSYVFSLLPAFTNTTSRLLCARKSRLRSMQTLQPRRIWNARLCLRLRSDVSILRCLQFKSWAGKNRQEMTLVAGHTHNSPHRSKAFAFSFYSIVIGSILFWFKPMAKTCRDKSLRMSRWKRFSNQRRVAAIRFW